VGADGGDQDREWDRDASAIPGFFAEPGEGGEGDDEDGHVAGFDADGEGGEAGHELTAWEAGFVEGGGDAHAVDEAEDEGGCDAPRADLLRDEVLDSDEGDGGGDGGFDDARAQADDVEGREGEGDGVGDGEGGDLPEDGFELGDQEEEAQDEEAVVQDLGAPPLVVG